MIRSFCDETINAERYTQVLDQHVLLSTQRLFQGRAHLFQQHNAKPITTEKKVCGY